MTKKTYKNFLIELVTEHIRQMEEEEHITAFSTEDLKLSKKYLTDLKRINNSRQELRIEDAFLLHDQRVVSFAMIFETSSEAEKFCKSFINLFPKIKLEELV